MPEGASIDGLGLAVPRLPPLASARPITPDATSGSNTPRAAGAELIVRVIRTSGIDGIGGHVDLTA